MIHPPPRQGARPLQHRRGVVLQREVDAPRPCDVHTGALIAAVEVHLPQLGLLPRFDQGEEHVQAPFHLGDHRGAPVFLLRRPALVPGVDAGEEIAHVQILVADARGVGHPDVEPPVAGKAHGGDGHVAGALQGHGCLAGGQHHPLAGQNGGGIAALLHPHHHPVPLPQGQAVQKGRRHSGAGGAGVQLALPGGQALHRQMERVRDGAAGCAEAHRALRLGPVIGQASRKQGGAALRIVLHQPAGQIAVRPAVQGELAVQPVPLYVADREVDLSPHVVGQGAEHLYLNPSAGAHRPLHGLGQPGKGALAGLNILPQGRPRRHGGDAQGGADQRNRCTTAERRTAPFRRKGLFPDSIFSVLVEYQTGHRPLQRLAQLSHNTTPPAWAAASAWPGSAGRTRCPARSQGCPRSPPE